ncbi:SPOR domain-containing protein [Paenibacillus periandrae]|uniref:SPOR domain-containing protein n=1 Tax=Paenibacillus periandrae TaxID=1761741 RepID=UPI001F094FDB|nr:SPOR domain-containing protein [Paenibacillus periandrae]
MSKAKMTFRFDQEYKSNVGVPERKAKEQQVIPLRPEEYKVTPVDTQTLNPYPNDFGGWESSFDMETRRVEKLIRESGPSTQQENRNENSYNLKHNFGREPRYEPRPESINDSNELNVEPNHRLLENEELLFSNDPIRGEPIDPIRDHRWYVPEETFYRRRKTAASWFKVAASVVGAVATGAAFGFLVLSMFSQDSGTNKTNVAVPTAANVTANNAAPAKAAPTDQAVAVSGAVTPSNTAGKAADPAGSIAASASISSGALAVVNVPAKTLTFLQSGVFSTSQGAAAAQSELKKKGLAAVSDVGEKFPVYVGMASNRDEASRLAQQFQQKNIDVIIKNVDMPALSKIKWTGKSTDNVAAFITQGDNLVQQIAPLTVSHLTEAKLTGMDASQVQSVKTAHQAWLGMTSGVNEGLSEEGKAAVAKISSAMNAAVTSLDEYRKSPSAATLWQTQNAILQAALAQKEFRRVITAS